MYDSLQIMKGIPVDDLMGLPLEEVVLKFQTTEDRKLQNRCFAYVFCNLFPMILKLHHKHPTLTLTERTEECICCTLHAMKKFGTKQLANKTKFSTFLYLVLSNSLKGMVIRSENNCKKKVWSNLISCDTKTLNYILDVSAPDKLSTADYNKFLMELDNSSILSKDEIEYCKQVLLGYKTNKEIAENMHITSVCNYNKKQKKFITKPVDERGANIRVAEIKRSIKRKAKENNYSVI